MILEKDRRGGEAERVGQSVVRLGDPAQRLAACAAPELNNNPGQYAGRH